MGSAKKQKRLASAANKPTPDSQHQPVTSSTNKTNYFLALLLLLATTLLYGHSLWNPLVFDDLLFFVDANLERLGSSFFQLDLRWFPYASFGWTYNLFGHDWFWYRLGNLGLHALTSILLFLFFSRLLDATQPQDEATRPHWPAFFAALVFALHPAAVYGVAYLVQRSILMATLFSIAALLCYMEGLSRDKGRWFVLSALFYFLAVFSKEHSIMLPGVAAALTLLLHKPSLALVRRVWLPFALYLVIGTLIILRTKGLLGAAYEQLAADILAQMSEQQEDIHIENPYPLSIVTQGFLFFKYLLLWIMPYTGWMAIDIRQPFATHFLSWPQLPGFILFLAYPVLAIKLLLKGGRRGLLGFGLLFPWILYLTELSTVRIQEPFVLYRSYLWMSGLPIVLFGFMGAAPRKFIPVLLAVCCLVLASLAWNRLDTFSDKIKIWSDAIEKNQDEKLLGSGRLYDSRGNAYMQMGQIERAQEDLIKAVTLNPRDANAHANLGAVNFMLKNFEAALQSYNTSIKLRPGNATAHNNRSLSFLQMGRYADALNDCEYVLQLGTRTRQLGTQNTDAYLHCSDAYSGMGKTQEALRYLDDALRINPRQVNALLSRSVINTKLGRFDPALSDLDHATRIDPQNASIYYKRGTVHHAMGRYQDAMQDYNKAIALNPDYVDAYINRGRLHVVANRLPQAILEFDRVVQLSPGNPLSYLNRGSANFKLGKLQEAMNDYNKALSLYDRAPRLDATYNTILLYRGLVLYALNRKNEAMESFRRSCDAGNPEACKELH